mmetsp:Transcript_8717/g.27154  ORF Transcript_8717/g.27154 Transcript_8717/m.27154 type:complete len:220 (+) Transcript_8717:1-660(+)
MAAFLLRISKVSPVGLPNCHEPQVMLLQDAAPNGHGPVQHQRGVRWILLVQWADHGERGVDIDVDVAVCGGLLPQCGDVHQESRARAVVGVHNALHQGLEHRCDIAAVALGAAPRVPAVLPVVLQQGLDAIRLHPVLGVLLPVLAVQNQVALVELAQRIRSDLGPVLQLSEHEPEEILVVGLEHAEHPRHLAQVLDLEASVRCLVLGASAANLVPDDLA